MKITSKSTAILCSYVTLGTYIPALLLHREFERNGLSGDLIALEQLFPENKVHEISKLKKAIHANFKLAKTALKMASRNNTASVDEQKLKALFASWRNSAKDHFIVFTGFWSDVVNRYLSTMPDHNKVRVDLIHMDADVSPSWKSYVPSYGNVRVIKLFDCEQKKLWGYISPNNEHDNSNSENNRILIHGGGWGIGTYKEKIADMTTHNLKLNVVAYEIGEIEGNDESIHYYLLDPNWSPYNGNALTFPSIYDNVGGRSLESEHYPYYGLVKKSRVIMSKPGGGTLNDSISSGVPVVFLDAFGEHEQRNAELWKALGYGIDYDDWKRNDFSFSIIENLEHNLKEGKKDLKTVFQNYYGTC